MADFPSIAYTNDYYGETAAHIEYKVIDEKINNGNAFFIKFIKSQENAILTIAKQALEQKEYCKSTGDDVGCNAAKLNGNTIYGSGSQRSSPIYNHYVAATICWYVRTVIKNATTFVMK